MPMLSVLSSSIIRTGGRNTCGCFGILIFSGMADARLVQGCSAISLVVYIVISRKDGELTVTSRCCKWLCGRGHPERFGAQYDRCGSGASGGLWHHATVADDTESLTGHLDIVFYSMCIHERTNHATQSGMAAPCMSRDDRTLCERNEI